MSSLFKNWINYSPKNRRAYLQEGLILDVTEQIWAKMKKLNLKQKDVAQKLDCTPAHISSVLSGSRNMTLRTLSDITDALDCDIKIYISDNTFDNQWQELPSKTINARWTNHIDFSANDEGFMGMMRISANG